MFVGTLIAPWILAGADGAPPLAALAAIAIAYASNLDGVEVLPVAANHLNNYISTLVTTP